MRLVFYQILQSVHEREQIVFGFHGVGVTFGGVGAIMIVWIKIQLNLKKERESCEIQSNQKPLFCRGAVWFGRAHCSGRHIRG